MRWLADLVYSLAGLVYLPIALTNALLLGKNRRGWLERFGFVPHFDAEKQRIWIHAVSLGEINATPRLVADLHESLPDCDIVFSTTTDTGYARAVELYGADRVFRFPLDFSWVVGRALRRIRPSLIVLVELEVWYNLLGSCKRRGIPVVIVNGRLTPRSAKRLAVFGALLKPMFAALEWVGVQDEAIAQRFRDLGTQPDRIEITSSLKWDTAQTSAVIDGARELGEALSIDASTPLWVCGSTGPGEETIILKAHRRLCDDGRRIQLAIVPRKPERFNEVFALIQSAGFECIRRSWGEATEGGSDEGRKRRSDEGRDARHAGTQGHRAGGGALSSTDPRPVILGDTMGELRRFYSLAQVVFVGRSLVALGGSDPIEVAALGKPVIVGPYMDNFQTPVDALRNADALQVVHDADALARAVAQMLSQPEQTAAMGLRAREVVLHHQGGTSRTVKRLVRFVRRKGVGSRMPLR